MPLSRFEAISVLACLCSCWRNYVQYSKISVSAQKLYYVIWLLSLEDFESSSKWYLDIYYFNKIIILRISAIYSMLLLVT
jgi:hypothetical protein